MLTLFFSLSKKKTKQEGKLEHWSKQTMQIYFATQRKQEKSLNTINEVYSLGFTQS